MDHAVLAVRCQDVHTVDDAPLDRDCDAVINAGILRTYIPLELLGVLLDQGVVLLISDEVCLGAVRDRVVLVSARHTLERVCRDIKKAIQKTAHELVCICAALTDLASGMSAL